MFHTDNQALAEVINKKTTKDRELLVLVRALVLSCLRHNILFRAIHLPGILNTKADALSRLQVDKFKSLDQDAERTDNRASPSVTRELGDITTKLLAASLNSASARVYRRPWTLFTTWAAHYLGTSVISLPVQPAVLALFISHLFSLHYASSSVTTYVSAIGYVHKLVGVEDPTAATIIVQILKGYRKLAPVRDVRLPITLPILRQLIQSFTHTATSAYQKCLMSGMCSLAFFAFLRIGEMTTTTGQQVNLINITQLDRLVDKHGHVKALQLSLFQYKHSDPTQPFVIYIYPEINCCPVQLILD